MTSEHTAPYSIKSAYRTTLHHTAPHCTTLKHTYVYHRTEALAIKELIMLEIDEELCGS